jgi:hypothetical protein
MARKGMQAGVNVIRTVLRVVVGVIGVLALLVAARLWAGPETPALALGLKPDGLLGLSTLRADVGGFFAAGGLFALAGAIRGEGRLLTPPAVLLGLALVGRLLTVVVDGYTPAMLQPMVIEAVLVAILLLARRRLR